MIGTSIGYAVRFDSKQDEEQTRVKFVTDGVLLQEMTSDPLLRRYSVIMIDEAHERSLQTDMCLGLLKKIQKVRPDLRIIVASATLDAEFFKDFFNHNLTDNSEADTATIIHLEGRTYPVDIFYLEKACPDYMKESMETVLKIHRENKLGDILVFVTSAEDCDSLCDNLRDEVGKVISKAQGIGVPLMKMKALPLYGSLPVIDQMRVFETLPRNTRKVIVSTNIAETSLTLPGIVHVIDAGFVKISAYNPKNGLDSTTTVPVSQAAANQRAGRAGRVRSGCCYRLYTQDDFEKLMPATVPEMRRSELTSTILRLKQLGISNVVRFDFPSPPPAQALSRSLELLFALGKVKNTHSNFITGLFRSRR
jgi:ATP-dependent RNA helicase DDX35